MLSVIGYGNTQIVLRGDNYTSELECDTGKIQLTFNDNTQIEIYFDKNTLIWNIDVIKKGDASQVLYKCTEKGVLFSSDIFSISSGIQSITHIKHWDGDSKCT